ncbi:aldehyde dehydrogenase family protein [Pseudomonas sp. B35(2017)]|uniref:aldehyde dehydrogenase family protein n=1 Tax=Pseudomonas sp. B35(2017) TaxID=1981722 RepID=UPI000A1F44C9|nr:aldehyde dehydrogenase family protein [Pseudomonas sp. B35(2017)]
MYLINGHLRDDCTLSDALEYLRTELPQRLATAVRSTTVIAAAAALAERLRDVSALPILEAEQRQALIDFCQPSALREKVERELGEQPDSLRRTDYRQSRFERWSPLGLVVHITPGNAPLLAFCAVVESLLAGNVNWLRPSASDTGLTAQLLHALVHCAPDGLLAGHVAVLPATTAQTRELCQWADGVSAWGGEAALQAISRQLPPGCRWIDWGHRISFAYLTPDSASPAALEAVVDEVCRLDQQACSSPQWLLVDSDDPALLQRIGAALAQAFERRSQHWPILEPTLEEASEITTVTAMARLGRHFAAETGHVWDGRHWRVIWSHDQPLTPSPLFRTVHLCPVPRAQLTETLLPWRNRLQSCALQCAEQDVADLSRRLLTAGVTRLAPAPSIHDGYPGEPHDGVYALQRLSRRVSVSLTAALSGSRTTLDEGPAAPPPGERPILSKDAFTQRPVDPAAQLYFRSGGSSGAPALAGFSHRDFRRHMRATADGLFAAGLEPARDRVMNLFFSGGLYGGFFSFAKALELLDVTHLPMGAPADDDYREIVDLIIRLRVTVLVGMPSTLHRLFLDGQERLRAYGGLEKVFTGGEHLSEPSRALMRSCGVSLIRSAIYGSVDAGPLGHACHATGDGIFHLMSETQQLEIVAFDADRPVDGQEPGRLLFTSIGAQSQDVQRYDIGDSGRWVPGRCACGLVSPRFELLDRHGKLIRIGTDFISLAELAQHLQTAFQVLLDHAPDGLERLRIRSERPVEDARQRLLGYPILATLIDTGLLTLEIERCPAERFTRNRHSGKTPLLIDSRR